MAGEPTDDVGGDLVALLDHPQSAMRSTVERLLADLDGPLPGGYCVLEDDAIDVRNGVEPPPTMARIETERDGRELEAWYRACASTAECRIGYTCQQHVCLPDGASPLVLDRTVEIEATCAEHHEIERREVGG